MSSARPVTRMWKVYVAATASCGGYSRKRHFETRTRHCALVPRSLSWLAAVQHRNLLYMPSFSQGSVEKWVDSVGNIAKRKQDKGYEKFVEGFAHAIEVKDNEDTSAVRAFSYRSLSKNEKPYRKEVIMRRKSDLSVQSAMCECKAGAARCSHIVALLYTLASYKKLSYKAVPPMMSKTSLPQKWHIPRPDIGIQPACVSGLPMSRVKLPKEAIRKQSQKRKSVTEGILPALYCCNIMRLDPVISWDVSLEGKDRLAMLADSH